MLSVLPAPGPPCTAAAHAGLLQDLGDISQLDDDEDDDDDSLCSIDSDNSVASGASLLSLGEKVFSREEFESLYPRSRKEPLIPCHIKKIDYHRCTTKELQAFVAARGLPNPYPEGLTLKYFYIHLLEKDDNAGRPFRFMDLPPEIRCLVYIELLTLPKDPLAEDSRCFPQILRMSRQIHEEAASILYGENDFRFAVSITCDDLSIHDGFVRIHAAVHRDAAAHCFRSVLMSPCPDFLRRVHNLSIHIHLDIRQNILFLTDMDDQLDAISDACEWLGDCLLNLASFLMDDHRLKKLQVLYEGTWDFEKDLKTILYPLERIRGVASVKVTGAALRTPGAAEKLCTQIQSNEPAYNTVKMFRLLRNEARAYLNREGHLGEMNKQHEDEKLSSAQNSQRRTRSSSNQQVSGLTALHGSKLRDVQVRQLYDALTSEMAFINPLSSEPKESEYRAMMASLEDHLNSIDQTLLSRNLQKLANATKARIQYMAQPGRLSSSDTDRAPLKV